MSEKKDLTVMDIATSKSAGDMMSFDLGQATLIKRAFPQLSSDQFLTFMAVSKARGMNPLSGQIYAIPRGGKVTYQISIDGFRAIAVRTGFYAGTDKPIYHYDEQGNLAEAEITVYRLVNGERVAIGATAALEEYIGTTPTWKKLPKAMLAKCAESLALRRAFPEDLSGLHSEDEMAQADRKIKDVSNETGKGIREHLRADAGMTPAIEVDSSPMPHDPQFEDDVPLDAR